MPLAVIQAIAHGALYLLSCGVATGEGNFWHLVASHLLRQVAGQGCRLGTKGQRQRTVMGLASLVCNVGLDHKVVVHGTALHFVWQI